MKPQFTKSLNRPWRAVIFATVALLLWAGCPQSSRGQQPVLNGDASSTSKPARITTGTDIRDGIRNGSLFYATAPLSEGALKRLDGTPAEASVTVPLTVDRVNNNLYVQAIINTRKVRLMLDTAAWPHVALNEATAHGIKLTDKVPTQISGSQGTETVTQGMAQSLALGKLTLRQIITTVNHDSPPFCNGILSVQIFEHYRVTLDFAVQTMTLTRGNVLATPRGGPALSLPFDNANGYIFVPVRVLDQAGWALLDSGSDMTTLSLKAAKAASTQVPSSDAKTIAIDQRFGAGDTAKKAKIIALKVPVPIFMNTGHEDVEFSTTSQVGMSDIDDVLDPGFDGHGNINAQLGFPFFLQFQRVIIDYPNHTLTLQYPIHDTPQKVADFPTSHDRAWPGYKWRQKGYAWIEIPDGKNSPPPASVNASPQATTITTTTTQTTGTTTITTLPDGTIAVIVNGVKSSYPSGSTIKIDNDGSVRIVPPPAGASPATPTGGK